MTHSPDDELTTAEVAELIGVDAATVRRYTYRGDMPRADRYVGRTPLWRYATIEQWTRSRPGAEAGTRGPRPRVL